MADERSVVEIERDLAQARDRLAANLSELVTQIHPKAVAHRTVADAKRQVREVLDDSKRKARQGFDWVKSQATAQFKDEAGWNYRALAIAGAGVAVVTLVILVAGRKR